MKVFISILLSWCFLVPSWALQNGVSNQNVGWVGLSRTSSAWWVVTGATVVAAYQPKGAASLAASYVNLANPGTFDAAPGTAPTWASGTGWTFNGTTQYLTTGVIPTNDQTWSLLIRFTSQTGNGVAIAFSRTGGGGIDFGFYVPASGVSFSYYSGNSYDETAGGRTSGVAGIAGATAYFNGSSIAAIPPNSGTATNGLYLGAANLDGTPGLYAGVIIQAVVVYSTTLSGGDLASLTTRMNAL